MHDAMQGQYDRVHCGAACPASKLGPLLELLRPEGGLIVTPVEPSDLRVIVKRPDGGVASRIISQVRYSTLEVRLPWLLISGLTSLTVMRFVYMLRIITIRP